MEHSTPSYVEALKTSDPYPDEPKKIKLKKTQCSYLFLADNKVYKIKKTGTEYSSLAVKEAFCNEECQLSQRYNPGWPLEVIPLMEQEGKYRLGGSEGRVLEYALKMDALTERRFLSSLLKKKKADSVDVSLIAQTLAEIHADAGMPARMAESGRVDRFHSLCDDMLYQIKRYFDASVTQPIIDMIRHPMEKFINEKGGIFAKRIRKGRVVQGHGALLPEHVHVQGETVRMISPLETQKKYSVLDVANDVASLMVELAWHNQPELEQTMMQKYLESSRDKDLQTILPVYQTYCALKQGVRTCEEMVALKQESLGVAALEYFNLAARYARTIPRD